jgi:hypothetical protein
MCECECTILEFEEYLFEEIVIIKELDQCPSLRLVHLIIKMFRNCII